MTDTDADAYELPTLPRYRSWAEREAAQRATRDAERDELAQRIQASRASQNRYEREGSQRRQLADIQVFRALMLDVLEHPLAKTKSPRSGSFASFKSVCSLIKQRSGEDPSFLSPGLSQSLPFFYKMVSTPAAWIAIADRLADHTRAGLTRENDGARTLRGIESQYPFHTGEYGHPERRSATWCNRLQLDRPRTRHFEQWINAPTLGRIAQMARPATVVKAATRRSPRNGRNRTPRVY